MSKFQRDLTQGSVARHLLAFSLPFLAANFLQALYNMADMLIVGNYSTVGAAAVGAGGQITILVINLISGLAVGGTVMIAQFMGQGRQDDMRHTIGTMFTLYGIAAVIMTVAMFIANPFILRLVAADDIFDEALDYLNICTGGTLFIFGYNAVSAVLRGMGDSRHPLIFVAISAGMNVVLDILFVWGLGLGAAGAAWATVIAQAFSFIVSVVFLKRRNFIFDFKLKSFRIDRGLVGRLIKIGIPASLQGTLVSISFLFLTSIARDIAGMVGNLSLGVAGKINSVAILPAIAMQASVSSMAGQNLGAGKPERARRTMLTAIGITLGITTAMFVLINLFAGGLVELFINQNDPDLTPAILAQCVEQGAIYIRSVSWDYLLVAVLFNIGGLAMAAGQTWFTLFNSMISSLLIRIPAAWILGKLLDLGLAGLGWAAPIASCGAMIVAIVYFASGVWKRGKVAAGIAADDLPAPAVEVGG